MLNMHNLDHSHDIDYELYGAYTTRQISYDEVFWNVHNAVNKTCFSSILVRGRYFFYYNQNQFNTDTTQ